MKTLKVLFFIFLFSIKLFAQLQNNVFQYITIKEGLPHNPVFCQLQDKNGFLWFGTQDGLVRYDGYECRIFRQQITNKNHFNGKNIQCLKEDKNGNLWVGTQGNGINIRDAKTGKFKNLSEEKAFEPISKHWIKTIFEDQKGRIWIGTLGNGLLLYEPNNKIAKHFHAKNSHLSGHSVSAFAQDKNGTIWVATNGIGIFYFDEQSQNFNAFHTNLSGDTDFESFRKTLFADANGNLWVGTEGSGLYQIHLDTKQIERFTIQNGLISNNIMDIAQDKRGQLLLATDGGGLNLFDPITHAVWSYRYGKTRGTLNTDALYDVLIDADENIWIGTYNGGVNIVKAHQPPIETFERTGLNAGELSHRSVLSMCLTTDNQLFVGTDGGGLNKFNPQNKTFTSIPNQPNGYGNVVKTIFEDRQKRLWLGYFNDGLSLFDKKTRTFKHYRTNPNNNIADKNGYFRHPNGNNIWSITDDKNGNIWIGLVGAGVHRFDPRTEQFQYFSHHPNDPLSIASNDVMTLLCDHENQLWIGTDKEGLDILNLDNQTIVHLKHHSNDVQSLAANDIRCIFQDSKKRIWVGTESGGLHLWQGNGQFQHFGTKEGLIANAVMSILEDKNGDLWLSTFKGISRFSPEKKVFLNFDFHKNLYLNSNQFNQLAALRTMTAQGVEALWFGGINGVSIIRPDDIRFFDKKPNIILTDFKIFDKSIAFDATFEQSDILGESLEMSKNITLSYRDNAFSIAFAALDFTDPLKNQYAYKMEGFDKEWNMANSEQRLAAYTNLDHGTYFFRVKGANHNGVWSDEKVLKIVIVPPFWKTWWFKLLILMLLAAFAFFLFRIYVTRREMTLRQQVLESERAILHLTNEKLASEQIVLSLKNEKLASEQIVLSLKNEKLASEQIVLSLQNEKLENEQAILSLQNEKLEGEVKAKNMELMSKVMQTAHKNEILIDIKEQLELFKKANENEKIKILNRLKIKLEDEIEGEKSWEQFTQYFDQVNQDFTTKLLQKHPTLTPNDLRICVLARLNMSNKEMAALLNISVNGVEKSRYRLKKRLNLTPEDDLDTYMRNFI